MSKQKRARRELESRGMSVTEFANLHDLPRSAVFYVLRGGRALRGNAHNAAVLLGVKKGEVRKHVTKHV